jgi:polysaccharide export outer membrane protein
VRTILAAWLVLVPLARAQTPGDAIPLPDEPVPIPQAAPAPEAGPDYRIGPDDLLNISVFEFGDLDTSARVTATGFVSIPLLEPIRAAGLTAAEVEAAVERGLSDGFINTPQVTVFIEEYGSQPVSVMGAVREPGVYQMQGRRYLLDMLAMAGGLDEAAGRRIRIIRRPSEEPGSTTTDLTLDLEDLLERGRTELNVPILAGDTIHVSRAGSVFVVGEVNGPGEFVLRNGRNVTVTQAVALGGGVSDGAKRSQSLIIRILDDGTRQEFPVDLDQIVELGAEDTMMQPNDILFVPAAVARQGITRALDVAVSVATSRLIWGGF